VVMSISRLMVPEGAALYYDPKFRAMLEDHMSWLLAQPENQLINVLDNHAYKYEGDLTGLLRQYAIQDEYHWLTMRANRMTSPMDYRADMKQLVVIDRRYVDQLRTVYQTTQRKIN